MRGALVPASSEHSGTWQGQTSYSVPEGLLCSPEVRVQGGICGHLNLNGVGILQVNNLSDFREGLVQPGCCGSLEAEGWLEDDRYPFPPGVLRTQ